MFVKLNQITHNLGDSHGCRQLRETWFKELGHLMLSHSEPFSNSSQLLPMCYLGCSPPRTEHGWDTALPSCPEPTLHHAVFVYPLHQPGQNFLKMILSRRPFPSDLATFVHMRLTCAAAQVLSRSSPPPDPRLLQIPPHYHLRCSPWKPPSLLIIPA